MVSRRTRLAFAAVLLAGAAALAGSYVSSPTRAGIAAYDAQAALPPDQRAPVVPDRENVTVVTGHGFDGETAALAAFGPDGRVLYYDDRYTGYFDVDPAPGGPRTVEYVAEKPLADHRADDCAAKCTVSLVERVNLTTGTVTRLHSRVIPQDRGANWHDADRLGPNRLLVGDILHDTVRVVNTSTEITTWRWDAQTDFPIAEGGPYPTDWAHLNDVEALGDGRYVASLRNQDQVVFLNRSGLQPSWTLGAEGDHSVLSEQHNPDYIPESEGGPALVVADSLNDRVVEYRREGGEWHQSWTWTDDEMVWSRDADRLPNGNTLVADTNGNRVLEVTPDGGVGWEMPFYAPYDAERLGTGDESTGGPAATRAELNSRRTDPGGLRAVAASILPRKRLNGLAFVTPPWMAFRDVAVLSGVLLTALAWAALELWHADFALRERLSSRLRGGRR